MDKKAQNSINQWIVNSTVRILDPETNKVSEIMSKESALQLSQSQNLDLVLINSKEGICRICDANKYFYALEKGKKVHKTPKIKDFSFKAKIQEHDIQSKAKRMTDILHDGNNICIKMFIPAKKRENEDYKNECLLKLRTIIDIIRSITDQGSNKPIKVTENPVDLSAIINRPK